MRVVDLLTSSRTEPVRSSSPPVTSACPAGTPGSAAVMRGCAGAGAGAGAGLGAVGAGGGTAGAGAGAGGSPARAVDAPTSITPANSAAVAAVAVTQFAQRPRRAAPIRRDADAIFTKPRMPHI